jgi:hypothetical protein
MKVNSFLLNQQRSSGAFLKVYASGEKSPGVPNHIYKRKEIEVCSFISVS